MPREKKDKCLQLVPPHTICFTSTKFCCMQPSNIRAGTSHSNPTPWNIINVFILYTDVCRLLPYLTERKRPPKWMRSWHLAKIQCQTCLISMKRGSKHVSYLSFESVMFHCKIGNIGWVTIAERQCSLIVAFHLVKNGIFNRNTYPVILPSYSVLAYHTMKFPLKHSPARTGYEHFHGYFNDQWWQNHALTP